MTFPQSPNLPWLVGIARTVHRGCCVTLSAKSVKRRNEEGIREKRGTEACRVLTRVLSLLQLATVA